MLLEEVNIRNANKHKDIKKSSRLKQLTFDETGITDGLKLQLFKLKEFDFALKNKTYLLLVIVRLVKHHFASTLGMNALEKRS